MASPTIAAAEDTMTLQSRAVQEGGLLPRQYTAEGRGHNPPLSWRDVPDGTAELALLVEDVDAGPEGGPVTRWLVAGLEPRSPGYLDENDLPEEAAVGLNEMGAAAYDAPTVPHGHEAHRIRFTLIASGLPLGLVTGFTREELEQASEGNVLAIGVLECLYGRTDASGPNPPATAG